MALVRPPVSYPGVYIQEVPSDVRTITPVDTATTAFLGRTLRGPVNEPVVCNSFADFQRIFGGLWIESKLGYAVNDFFLNGGAKAVIVRLFSPAPNGQADAKKATKALVDALSGADAAALKSEADAAAAKYSDPGSEQDAANYVKSKVDEAAQAPGATKESVLKAAQQAAADLSSLFAELSVQHPHPAALAIYNAVRGLSAVAAIKQAAQKKAGDFKEADAEAAKKVVDAISGQPDDAKVDAVLTAALDEVNKSQDGRRPLALKAKYEGSWGNRLVARVTDIDPKVVTTLARQYDVPDTEIFNLTIRDTKTGAEEFYPNVTVVPGPRQLDKVLAQQSELVVVDGALPAANGGVARPTADNAPAPLTNWWEDQLACTTAAATAPATDGITLNPADFEGDQAAKLGLYALEHADIFNMLCIPPYDGDSDVPVNVLAAAAAYCEKRRAMLIVDPPGDWTSKDIAKKNFPIPGLSPTANAAVFFPRIKEQNPLHDNQVESFVPCGAVAGVMARTDFRRGVWKAAAGLEATLNGVLGLDVPLTDAENGELNPLGINCLRSLPVVGPVIWGARTLVGDDRLASQWKYVPVRRMALWIEESLYQSTQWAVFEPNDEPLWSSLRLNIGVFMNDLFRQGAFQGQSAKDAYFVKCDSSTTTQADINRGIVNVVVGFAPLKPAEFVILYIQQITGNLAV